MIGVLIVAHGKFPSGIYSSLKMIYGVNENIKYIDFLEEMSAENLKESIEKELKELLIKNDGVICLTDIKGGTPYKICAEISLENNKIKVVSGTNLPLLISIVDEMSDISLEDINSHITLAKEQIDTFALVLKEKKEETYEDGI